MGQGCCGESGARVPQGSPLPPPACASRLLALLPPRHCHFRRKTFRSRRHFSTGVQTLGPAHLVFQSPRGWRRDGARGWPVNPNGSLGTGGGGLADGGEEGCRLRTRQLRPRSIDCGSPAGAHPGRGTHASAARSRCVGLARTPAPGCRPPNPTHPGLISLGAPLSGPFPGDSKPGCAERGTYCRGPLRAGAGRLPCPGNPLATLWPSPPRAAPGCAQCRR